jgi:hypothetical protein
MSWAVDTSGPELFVVSPANHTVTRNGTMTVTVQPNEPLSELMVLQPGDTVWTKVAGVVSITPLQTSVSPLSLAVVATVDTDGLHCIKMKGVDQVGNVQTMPLRFELGA